MKNILFALLILFSACKKESVQRPTEDHTEQNTALLQGTWAVTASTINPAYDVNNDGTKETNRLANLPDCNRIFILFLSSNIVKIDCSHFLPLIWHLSDYGETLNWHTGINADSHEKIIILNSTTLQTEITLTPPDGVTYTITNTYTKQ